MESSNDVKVWNDYFGSIRGKYDMRVSPKKPLVIFLDGKNVTTGNNFSLLDNSKDSFQDIMEQTIKHFTAEYDCMALFGVDEVSFILKSAESIIDKINSSKNYRSNEITSIFSQYFFEYFNKMNPKELVYWHSKCYSIPEQKIESYIRYRSKVIFNTFTTYFLKKNNIKDAGHIKFDEKIKRCKQIENYKELEEYAKGILYLNGEKIDLDEYLKGNIKSIEITQKHETEFLDLKAFDDLF